MLGLSDGLGPLGEQHRNAALYPVRAPQARVVQQVLVSEVQQVALVDWAGEDLQQPFRQDHEHLPRRQ